MEYEKHKGAPSVAKHDHPMHRGPHHDHYIHGECQVKPGSMKGSHNLGDKNHIDSVKGEPHGADVEHHNGKMSW